MTTELRYERVVTAPAETVFDAFTSPHGQLAFYSENADEWIVHSQADVHVGGTWSIRFGPSAEQLYRHHHVFEVIDRPRRIVLSTTETRLDGSTLTFETEFIFEPHRDGTLMVMIQRGLPTDELRAEHARGVPGAFDRLTQYIRTHVTS
jgi:uncharacterized protein YndB with AHSA1/START domain